MNGLGGRLTLNLKTVLFHGAEGLFLGGYMLDFVTLFTVFPLTANDSYTVCSKLNSPGSG